MLEIEDEQDNTMYNYQKKKQRNLYTMHYTKS